METIRTDVGDVVGIPESLGKNISRGAHLRKIGPVEDNAVNRLQMNLRVQLIELLRSREVLSPTDFTNRKMELLAMVPSDLHNIPSIQEILKDVRNATQAIEKPKTRIEIIGESLKRYLGV